MRNTQTGRAMATNTFRPVIRENEILAGGVTIAQVDDEGRIIFVDRYERRCYARGSRVVPVSLVELLETIVAHYRGQL